MRSCRSIVTTMTGPRRSTFSSSLTERCCFLVPEPERPEREVTRALRALLDRLAVEVVVRGRVDPRRDLGERVVVEVVRVHRVLAEHAADVVDWQVVVGEPQ